MNRNEKNLQTRQKIIDFALLEFGEKNYAEASLNTICSAGNISKGIIYHYFKNKDELYLICVKKCFDALTDYLSSVVIVESTLIETSLEGYFEARIAFFANNPLYLNLFCNAMMTPPAHLSVALAKIKAELDTLNISMMSRLLKNVRLRSDITKEEVIEFFCKYQDFVNAQFKTQTFNEQVLKEHERQCSSSLKIMLYGIIMPD